MTDITFAIGRLKKYSRLTHAQILNLLDNNYLPTIHEARFKSRRFIKEHAIYCLIFYYLKKCFNVRKAKKIISSYEIYEEELLVAEYAHYDFNDKDEKNKLILIEEPEDFMHQIMSGKYIHYSKEKIFYQNGEIINSDQCYLNVSLIRFDIENALA